jgi:hypothetical protein
MVRCGLTAFRLHHINTCSDILARNFVPGEIEQY